MKKLLLTLICTFYSVQGVELQPHEKWWAVLLNNSGGWTTIDGWAHDYNARSRKLMRKHVKAQGYKSILDIPCGPGTEYFGFKHDKMTIDYYGIDVVPQLVDYAVQQGINATQASIEAIPFPDNSIEFCFSRYILEHLPYYDKAINELIRVSQKEVLIVFFINPGNKADNVHLIHLYHMSLYNNYYNRKALEQFVKAHPKVKSVMWKDLGVFESFLHIYLK